MLWVFYVIKAAVALGILRQPNKVLLESLACEESPEAVAAVDQTVHASRETSDEAGVQAGLIKNRPTLAPTVITSPRMKGVLLETSPSASLIGRLPDLSIKSSVSSSSSVESSLVPTIETPGWIQRLIETTEEVIETISGLGVDVSRQLVLGTTQTRP
eukprot:Protomagalhaensia_wolfi_Nauph_80__1166@NODE_1688_length_1397_cov_13_667158_g1311_i0_p2_GENE_NODE_1688_length_1397_cov_13_667158_g1311_i0NODE_1688_length_1397_cov_13_667158_g1311_i0_p2_ORF_typecomplete_len158_score26_21_NODE_1688_length_1397_cov_13_667158_g1311_i0128601